MPSRRDFGFRIRKLLVCQHRLQSANAFPTGFGLISYDEQTKFQAREQGNRQDSAIH